MARSLAAMVALGAHVPLKTARTIYFSHHIYIFFVVVSFFSFFLFNHVALHTQKPIEHIHVPIDIDIFIAAFQQEQPPPSLHVCILYLYHNQIFGCHMTKFGTKSIL